MVTITAKNIEKRLKQATAIKEKAQISQTEKRSIFQVYPLFDSTFRYKK